MRHRIQRLLQLCSPAKVSCARRQRDTQAPPFRGARVCVSRVCGRPWHSNTIHCQSLKAHSLPHQIKAARIGDSARRGGAVACPLKVQVTPWGAPTKVSKTLECSAPLAKKIDAFSATH